MYYNFCTILNIFLVGSPKKKGEDGLKLALSSGSSDFESDVEAEKQPLAEPEDDEDEVKVDPHSLIGSLLHDFSTNFMFTRGRYVVNQLSHMQHSMYHSIVLTSDSRFL